jgi:hypothetical protein
MILSSFAVGPGDDVPRVVCPRCGCGHVVEAVRNEVGGIAVVKVCRHCGQVISGAWRVAQKPSERTGQGDV